MNVKRGDVDPITGLVFWQRDPKSKGGARWYTPEKFEEISSRHRELNVEWADKNRDRVREQGRIAYGNNRPNRLASGKRWRDANREKKRATDREWKKRNPDKIVARDHRRRGVQVGRLHPQHDMRIERTLQRLKRRASACLALPHHLDHIVPLGAGGWHHHLNLQVIPAYWNLKKRDNPRFVLPDCYANNAPIPPANNTEVFAT